MYTDMSQDSHTDPTVWFAIRSKHDFQAEEALAKVCDEVFFPKEQVTIPGRKPRVKAVIPHVLFIRTTRSKALALETEGRQNPGLSPAIWIYRYPSDNTVQVIPQQSIDLLRLLTSDDTTRCRVYNSRDFKPSERVRVTGGIYQGYEGYVRRIAKNRHVVVSIEGVCMVILPFIHPDLLEPVGPH